MMFKFIQYSILIGLLPALALAQGGMSQSVNTDSKPAAVTSADPDRMTLSPQTSKDSPIVKAERQKVSVTVTNEGLVAIHNVSFWMSDELSDRIELDDSSGQGNDTTFCDQISSLSAGKSCTYQFRIKQTSTIKTLKQGLIHITSTNADNKVVHLNIEHPSLKVSKTTFTQPTSNSVKRDQNGKQLQASHDSIVVTNDSSEGLSACIDDAVIPSGQKYGSGVTMADSNFVNNAQASNSCLQKKFQCQQGGSGSGDQQQGLQPGSSCTIKVNVSKKAYGSNRLVMHGNFGVKLARINVAKSYVTFFRGDDTNGDPQAIIQTENADQTEPYAHQKRSLAQEDNLKETRTGKLTIKNNGNFDVSDIQFDFDKDKISIEDNGCNDTLKVDNTCTMKLNVANFGWVFTIKSPNLPNGKQNVTVGNRDHCKRAILSDTFLKHQGSYATEPGQIAPNMLVFRLFSPVKGKCENGGAKSKKNFLEDLDDSLDPEDFRLWPTEKCIKENGDTTEGWANGSSGRCDRVLIYKPQNSSSMPSPFFDYRGGFSGNLEDSHGDTHAFMIPKLLVGGHFLSAGRKPNTTNLAAWGLAAEDAAPVWQSVGLLDQGATVNALRVANSGNIEQGLMDVTNTVSLYVGGRDFRGFGVLNTDVANVGLWQGCPECWQPLKTPNQHIVWDDDSQLTTFAARDTDSSVSLFTGGDFQFTSGPLTNNMAVWQLLKEKDAQGEASWQALESYEPSMIKGANGAVNTMFWNDDAQALIVAGAFDQVGDLSTQIASRIKENGQWQWASWGTNSLAFEGYKDAALPEFFDIEPLDFQDFNDRFWAIGGRYNLNGQHFLAIDADGQTGDWQVFNDLNLSDNGAEDRPGVYVLGGLKQDYFYVGGQFAFQGDNANSGDNLLRCRFEATGPKCNPQALGNPNGRVKAAWHGQDILYIGGDFDKIGSGENPVFASKIVNIVNPTNSSISENNLNDVDTGHSISPEGTVNAIAAINTLAARSPSG